MNLSEEIKKELEEARTVTQLAQLVELARQFDGQTSNPLYRGESRAYQTSSCVPTIGRDREDLGDTECGKHNHNDKKGRNGIDLCGEEYFLDLCFGNQCLPHVSSPLDSYLERLVLAQHHGIPTRLLDWTTSLYSATFFAIKDDQDQDGYVFVNLSASRLSAPMYKVESYEDFHFRDQSDWGAGNDLYIHTPHVTVRAAAQDSTLVIQKNPCKRGRVSCALKVPAKAKQQLMVELRRISNHAKLFPDLDGISAHIKWLWNAGLLPRNFVTIPLP